jgi:uncharacterized membrane protein
VPVNDDALPPPQRKGRASLRRYLIAGVLVWLPVLATVWVLATIVGIMDRTLLLLPASARPDNVFGFHVPGLGILFAFFVLLVTGISVTNLIGRGLVRYWEDLLQRIPLVRSIYGGVKGFAETILSNSGNSFRRVVMIEYPRAGAWSLGFVTAENLGEVNAKVGTKLVCVFIPTTPNPTSGFIVMVPKAEVVELEMSVDAAMKMIVTLGVVAPPPPAQPAPRAGAGSAAV